MGVFLIQVNSFDSKHGISKQNRANCEKSEIMVRSSLVLSPWNHQGHYIRREYRLDDVWSSAWYMVNHEIFRSLGITLLEILTIIPVWIHQKCNIFGKSTAPRQGLLSTSDRDLKKLLKKEEKLIYIVSKLIE